ncbi:hypothetical protein RUND412_007546 [Rhizina undulata]
MTSLRASTVFRIKDVPSTFTVADLAQILRGKLSKDENQVNINITFVPSCYWSQRGTKWALVDFQPIPSFLQEVAYDKTESRKVYLDVEDETLTIDVNFYGFTQLYEVKGAEIAADIVAVTGLGGHAYGSWRGKQTKKMWLRDFMAQDLKNCRTMIYGYNSNLNSRGFHTVKDYKIEFLNEIAKVRKSEESLVEAATRKGEMESFAGNSYLLAATCAVIFFGTPHRGISLDDVRKMLEDYDVANPRIGLLDEIKNELNLEPDLKEFLKLAEGLKVLSFYERLQTAEVAKNSENRYTRSGNFKATLDVDSALLRLPKDLEETIPVNSDHTNMVKFDHKRDTTYEDVIERMQKYVERARDHVKERFRSSVSKTLPTTFQEFTIVAKLPFRRNPKFCGRVDILENVSQILQPLDGQAKPSVRNSEIKFVVRTTPGQKIAVLYGMGGAGKSQIALEYAFRFSDYYTSIFWIDADNVSRTADSTYKIVQQLVDHYATKWRTSPDYSEIASTLGIPGKLDDWGSLKLSDTETAMKAVHNWLGKKENRGWLLLVDNHDNAEEGELDRLIPVCDWGSIVITTRLPDLHRFGTCVEVEAIGAESGLELLLRSSGKFERKPDDAELEEAREIVKTLGELALALDQAGAYIASLQLPFYEYRERLKKGMKAVFRKKIPGHNLLPQKASVLTTWELSFQALSKNARQLLHFCAFLSNEDIPDKLFRYGKSAVPWIMEDEHNLDDAIENLFTFSLAKRKESRDSFWIHPLVHVWARERNDNKEQRQIAEDTLALVATSIFNEDHKSSHDHWVFQRRISSHLSVCEKHIADYFAESDSQKIVEASSAIGLAYKTFYSFKKAEVFYRTELDRREKIFGEHHVSTSEIMQNIGKVFYVQDRYDEALEWYQKEFELKEKALGKYNPSTIETVDRIAETFRLQGRFDEALEWDQRALEGKENSLGTDDPGIIRILYGISKKFRDMKRYDQAIEWYKRTLERKDRVFGKHHSSTLETVDDIADCVYIQERYDEALEWYQQVLERKEMALGMDHYSTFETMDHIAECLIAQERDSEALEWYQRALERKDKALGKDHPSTLQTVHDIAEFFFYQERYDKALEWYRKESEVKERTLGKDHPDTLYTLKRISLVLGAGLQK